MCVYICKIFLQEQPCSSPLVGWGWTEASRCDSPRLQQVHPWQLLTKLHLCPDFWGYFKAQAKLHKHLAIDITGLLCSAVSSVPPSPSTPCVCLSGHTWAAPQRAPCPRHWSDYVWMLLIWWKSRQCCTSVLRGSAAAVPRQCLFCFCKLVFLEKQQGPSSMNWKMCIVWRSVEGVHHSSVGKCEPRGWHFI